MSNVDAVELDILREEYFAAVEEFHLAEVQLKWADVAHIDIAIYQFNAAESKVNACLEALKDAVREGDK